MLSSPSKAAIAPFSSAREKKRCMHPAKAAMGAYRHQRTHMGPMIVSSHRVDRDAPLRGDSDDRLIGLVERVV